MNTFSSSRTTERIALCMIVGGFAVSALFAPAAHASTEITGVPMQAQMHKLAAVVAELQAQVPKEGTRHIHTACTACDWNGRNIYPTIDASPRVAGVYTSENTQTILEEIRVSVERLKTLKRN